MSWKYGTILRDDHSGGHIMIVREIPKNIAGEDDLFEAIKLEAEPDDPSWMAISPKDGGFTEIMDEADPNVIVIGGVAVRGATWTASGIEIEPPPLGKFTISYEER